MSRENPDKIEQVLETLEPRIRKYLKERHERESISPFCLCISGPQGSGKTTWAAALSSLLRNRGLKSIVVSIDDFYYDHKNLVRVKETDSENGLLRARGQPGTHDEVLAKTFFDSLAVAGTVHIPSFDKSKFNGEGDRVPKESWTVVETPLDVVIFEGWCVGFRALGQGQLLQKWDWAKANESKSDDECPTLTVHKHKPEHVEAINQNLKRYNETFMNPQKFHFFIHLDAKDLRIIYRWRLEQEHVLWKAKGTGMSDEAVKKFVMGYMPAYELYLEQLRHQAFIPSRDGEFTQMRLVLGESRTVDEITTL